MEKKKVLVIMILFLVVLLSLSFVSAYKLLCLTYGRSIPSEQNPMYTCWHDSCINLCVTDNNYPTDPDYCYSFGACELFGETELDITPPNLTINSPINDYIYSSRSVLFDIGSNEPFSLYYIDNIDGGGRWSRLGSNIPGYYKKISFKDGLNSITIKGRDRNNNDILIQKQFYVDSTKPKIKKTEPRKGFASGEFYVEIQEENPTQLVLNYGNGIVGYRNEQVDLNLENNDCELIKGRSGKYGCDVEVELEDYDGQNIEYWFVLTDIANSVAESRHYWLEVDTTFPVLNNDNTAPGEPDSFWTQGEGRYNKYIYFTFNVTEENFDEITYIDWTDTRPRERRLCSRLKDGICEKRKSFRRGHHILDIQIYDEAGNSISERIEFDVDY